MLTGCIDAVDRHGLHGWAYDPDYPAGSVPLLVTAEDRLLERVVANVGRPDVQLAGFGHGRAGFEVVFDPPLTPARSWVLHVRSEITGHDIPGSPVRIEASGEFDDAAQRAFAASLAAFGSRAELDRRIDFLGEQRERLLQMRADLPAQAAPSGQALAEPGPGKRRRAAKRKRALFIDQQMAQADHDGGSDAILSHMRSAQRLGFDVTFVAATMAGGAGGAALEAMGIACCASPWLSSVEEVLRRHAGGYDVVYVHRVASATAYTALVRQHMPHARLVYSVADLHHLRTARQATMERRPELMAEARRLRGHEIWAAQAADAVITHSSAEAGALQQALPAGKIHTVPWSVLPQPTPVPFEQRSGMAFIGHYRHAPNQDAARTLRDEILPMALSGDPAITLRLVGSELPEALRTERPGLIVDGQVPRLYQVFDRVRLTVAPLGYGAGLKAKVLESLAAGVPCVCSPVAAEGMGLPPRLAHLVVPDAAAMVREILHLHADQAHNERTAKRGLAFVARTFSEARLDGLMRQALLPDTAAAAAA